jgi:FK506-binding nuclear protein
VIHSELPSHLKELPSNAAPPKSLKRPSDAMDEDAPGADGLSKKQKKKLAKKLKNADGDAVAVSTASTAASVQASPDAKKKEKKTKEKKDGGEKEKKENDEKLETKTHPGGLVIKDAKKGTGKAAKNGNQLSMRYIGKLENGKVFDKNTGGTPVSVTSYVTHNLPKWYALRSSGSALVKVK